jgi:sensor histidine kinase YesM
LLGNLLENAIEAARQTDRKYLSVNISLKKGVLLIQIDNSYLPDGSKEKSIDAMKSFYIQRGKQHQGLGLKNVKRILEAHNGSLEITKKDDVFSVKALLYTTTMK